MEGSNIFKYTDDHIINLNPSGEYLYGFVVDIDYPKNLHDRDLNLQFYVINLYL